MKLSITILVLTLFFINKSAIAVYVDSTYIYTKFHSTDSSHLYLVAQVTVGQKPCSLTSAAITDSENLTTVILCYTGGVTTEFCPRIDTVDLGVKENGTINIMAIFQENTTTGFCRGSFLYKDTFEFVINTDYTSIASPLSLNGLLIYPNPTNDKLNCVIDKPTPHTTLQLFTPAGRAAAPAMPVTQTNTEIDVSTLPAGLYFLHLQDDRQRVVKKLVKY